MFSRVVFTVIFTFVIFSFSTFAQRRSDNYSRQPHAGEASAISTFRFGEGGLGNCLARFPRDLVVVDTAVSPRLQIATFSGGARVGRSIGDEFGGGFCTGLKGYASVSTWRNGSDIPAEMSQTITISFAPNRVIAVNIMGRDSQDYVISVNGASHIYTSPPYSTGTYRQSANANLEAIGFTPAQLSNVSSISITPIGTDWEFATEGIILGRSVCTA